MGDYGGSAPSYGEYMNALSNYYTGDIGSYSQSVNNASQQNDLSNLGISNLLTQGYSNIGLQNLTNYAMPYNQIGQQIENSNAQAGANTNLAQISGAGGQVSRVANQLEQQVNPEYYQIRGAAGNQATNLVNSINLNGLSGGEQAAVERSLAQSNYASGNLGLDNATNAVSNAMNFGDYLNTKRTALSNALNTASTTMNAVNNTSWNPVSTALSQPDSSTQSNWGTSQFAGTTKASGTNENTTSSDLMSSISSLLGSQMGYQYSANASNSFGGILSSQTSSIGDVCCFIFLEAYHGTLPWWVRECRDYYYRECPQLASGYRRMAKWLVPIMRHSRLVRGLVWHVMVKPITEYGKWMVGLSAKASGRASRNFWFRVWSYLGR